MQKAASVFTSTAFSDPDGARTRNHRIDSPASNQLSSGQLGLAQLFTDAQFIGHNQKNSELEFTSSVKKPIGFTVYY